MRLSESINSIVTDDSVTLYWEKPEELPKEFRYRIFLNGVLTGETEKTHYTVEKLCPETVYQAEIKLKGRKSEEREQTWRIQVKTGKKKTLLDVSKAPYLAVGDGKTLNTKALQQAINDCGPEQAVYFPKGIFLTGALRLHSDMELYLEEEAILQGTEQIEDYLPKIKSRFEGTEMECYSSLLNLGELNHESGYNCKNVIIRGKGTIAGGGKQLAKNMIRSERERLKAFLADNQELVKECENESTIPGRVRSRLMNLSNCENVDISGVTLRNGASWNVHMIYSSHITTHNCTFYSEGVWNGDGWDPDSSSHCTIFGCTFYTEDDSIAIKSGKNPEGNVINKPCEHIRIFDCNCAYGHGIAIGSEMSGGIHDVSIWDCDMGCSMSGIEIKATAKRGGYVRNIHVRDCKASRIMFHSVGYNDDGTGADKPPVFENCSFENIHILGEYYNEYREWVPCEAIELSGFEQEGYEVHNISFRNIALGNGKAGRKQTISLQLCEGVCFENVSCV